MKAFVLLRYLMLVGRVIGVLPPPVLAALILGLALLLHSMASGKTGSEKAVTGNPGHWTRNRNKKRGWPFFMAASPAEPASQGMVPADLTDMGTARP